MPVMVDIFDAWTTDYQSQRKNRRRDARWKALLYSKFIFQTIHFGNIKQSSFLIALIGIEIREISGTFIYDLSSNIKVKIL